MTRQPILLLAATLATATSLVACGASSNMPNTCGFAGLPISVATADVVVPASGGTVALPPLVPSPIPSNYGLYIIAATFSALPAAATINVTDFGGDAGVSTPSANIWGATFPVPLQDIEMVFPAALSMSSTPSITIANLSSQANAPYYYNELFDAGVEPTVGETSPPSTLIASEKVNYSSTWPAGTIILPSMNVPWSIVAGHQYIFEIVSSTGTFLSCSGSYN